LHSGSIIGGLLALQSEYLDVAIVNPRFHDFDDADQKMCTAKGYGAANARAKFFVISVINLGHHGGAFFVETETKICYLFDPMQLTSNLSALKEAVLTVVEKMLDMTDQLDYHVIAHYQQRDGTSCGIWCLVVLELLLFGATPETWSDYWKDSLYEVVGYLRLRYLRKVISLQLQQPQQV
ncbi:hypothetical protein PHYSODRAFT_490078, partial [Phytophthora sojae]